MRFVVGVTARSVRNCTLSLISEVSCDDTRDGWLADTIKPGHIGSRFAAGDDALGDFSALDGVEPYKPQTFKAQENERRRTLNDHVREMVRELAATVREVAAQAMDVRRKGVGGLLNALRVKGKQEAEEQARRAAEARRREEERKEALRQQALREARERATREAKERLGDMATV